MRATVAALIVSCAIGVSVFAGQAGQGPEELARRHYELGLQFMQDGKFSEALKDFQTVVDSYPTSGVAGPALLEIARYQLDIMHDAAAAQATTDTILKKYASTEAAAAAYVLSGRIAIEKARTPSDVDAALASFARVPTLFPGSDVVPASIYYAGEVLRAVRRHSEALERYRDVTLRYPESIWSARALLSSAISQTAIGNPIDAIRGLQRVRAAFAGSPEAETALNLSTILYRLYIRAPAQPSYAFSGRVLGSPTAKFKDVVAVAVDRHGNVLLAHKLAVTVFDVKGNLVRSMSANEPAGITLTPQGTVVAIRQNQLVPDGGSPIVLSIPQPDGRARTLEDLQAAVMTARGDWLVTDRKAKAVQLFSGAAKYQKAFVSAAADRLALDSLDDLAVLDRDAKTVSIFDRDAKPIVTVQTKGAGYELDNPVDIAYDALGHLYVLDRGNAAVDVFNSQGKLVTSFSIPEKNAGAFQKGVAFGLDAAGRLFIFDDRAQHVKVYQ